MTPFDEEVLKALRVFGPCSNAVIARRIGCKLHQSYRALNRLTQEGMSVHPKLQAWDVSRLGREWFDKQDHRPLRLFEAEVAK